MLPLYSACIYNSTRRTFSVYSGYHVVIFVLEKKKKNADIIRVATATKEETKTKHNKNATTFVPGVRVFRRDYRRKRVILNTGVHLVRLYAA